MRGFCMMAILFDHTEIYYTGANIVPYSMYVFDVLLVFFFVSGYFSFLSPLSSMIDRLLKPYILFTLALAIPKMLLHKEDGLEPLVNIVTGNASWFVVALMVSLVLFALLSWISRGRQWVMCIGCIMAFLIAIALSTHFTWCWLKIDLALMVLPFLYLGYLYRRHEAVFHRLNTPLSLFLILIVFIIIKVYVYESGAVLLVAPFRTTSHVLYVVNGIVSCLLMTSLCKQLPRMRMVEWTGSHSLVYYFLCGAAPLLTSMALTRLGFGYNGQYWHVLVTFALVYLVATAATWFTYRYLPFMIGHSRH